VLGRKIKFIQEDGGSDWPTFAEKAKKLLVSDKVASVMGCWTSASRKAVLPVFEQYNGMLYYPTFYEGLEASKNVIYTGQEATQQTSRASTGCRRRRGQNPSTSWARTTSGRARPTRSRASTSRTSSSSGSSARSTFPLGSTQFNSVINKMKLAKPDVIYAIIVGGSNVAFYKQLKAAGFDLKQADPDDDLGHGRRDRWYRRREYRGRLCVQKYFQSLDNPNNKGFVDASIRCGVPRPSSAT